MVNQLKKMLRERGIPIFDGIHAEDFGKHTKRKEKLKERMEKK